MSGPSHLERSANEPTLAFDGSSKDESERNISSQTLNSEANQMKQLTDKGAPGLRCEQDSTGNCSNGVSANNIPKEQSVKLCNDNDLTGRESFASKNGGSTKELSEREINHKAETNKLPEAHAQEHCPRDTNEFRDDILGTRNKSEPSVQNKVIISHEIPDNNNTLNSNSEIGLNGVNGCSPSDDIYDEQQRDNTAGHQQTTQDSDLSPSHSSISAKTNNDNDDLGKEHEQLNNSSLGRNRRVRQKNRYFNDFHCMQLVKGCRSRDDYDAYSPSTSATRSSNRRSTTDSSRNSPGTTNQPNGKAQSNAKPPPGMISLMDLFHDKYCRKCAAVKPHDNVHDKCQICLYDEIIAAEKRRKASLRSSSKSKPKSPVLKTPPKEEPLIRSQHPVEVSQKPTVSASSSNNGKVPDGHQPIVNSIIIRQEHASKSQTSDSQKRKWVVKPGKSLNDDDTITESNEYFSGETNDEPKRKVIIKTAGEQPVLEKRIEDGNTRSSSSSSNSSSSDSTSAPSSKSIDSNAVNNAGDNENDNQASPSASIKPDTWTSEQVAQYISSKGFTSESNLFLEQDVDGISLLMMKRQDFTYGLKMKLGPALKLFEQVRRLRREYEQEAAIAS